MSLKPVVLFDFDGTLANTIPLIVQSYHHTLQASGLPAVDDVEVRSSIGRPLRPVFEERYPGRGDELIETYRAWNLAQHDVLIERVEGVSELLDALAQRSIRIGVVSSKRAPTVRRGLRAVGLEGAIDVLAGMDETTRHKPDPEPLLFAAGLLGVVPRDCAYVGDAGVDVMAAQAAGMAAVAVTWGAGTRDELESLALETIVDSVAELQDVLLTGGSDVETRTIAR